MTFVQRTDWVDLPSIATPVMAADLLRIEQGVANAAVLGDVATSGTPTGDALRAAFVGGRACSTDGTDSLPTPAGTGLEFVITATGLQDIRFNGTSL